MALRAKYMKLAWQSTCRFLKHAIGSIGLSFQGAPRNHFRSFVGNSTSQNNLPKARLVKLVSARAWKEQFR